MYSASLEFVQPKGETMGGLLSVLYGVAAYVLVGIGFEERDLLELLGERYRTYRERVGMLLPRVRVSREER